MATSRDTQSQPNELVENSGEIASDGGGQSGDTQGLSTIEDAADESVEELADTGQDYEAGVVVGLEDAADHPEKPVHTHEDQQRPRAFAPEHGSE
jgi:hypothetical protein